MSAAPSPALETVQRRAFPRQPVQVTLDVLVLRSGLPEDLPGRCTDLSESGVGAIIAGQLFPGQQVAVQFRLPNVGVPVRARAFVRYQDLLRCGLQFVDCPVEQREMIRYWLYRAAAQRGQSARKNKLPRAGVAAPIIKWRGRRIRVPLHRLYILVALMVSLAALTWWQWQKSWRELEAQASFAVQAGTLLRVSPEVMQKRIVYKEDPVYPEAARLAGKQGIVVLDVAIGADGAVRRVRAVSGPEVLAQAAADALQAWKFEPYQTGGKSVEVETTVAVDFKLN